MPSMCRYTLTILDPVACEEVIVSLRVTDGILDVDKIDVSGSAGGWSAWLDRDCAEHCECVECREEANNA